jgi:hypothetical protein
MFKYKVRFHDFHFILIYFILTSMNIEELLKIIP